MLPYAKYNFEEVTTSGSSSRLADLEKANQLTQIPEDVVVSYLISHCTELQLPGREISHLYIKVSMEGLNQPKI